ncbi:MAG: aminotransferase class IV [Candidatus Omnitrophota bacterium]
MKSPIINLNRQWIEAPQELLYSLSPGVIRGEGVFETILVEHGQVCFWEKHFQRFQRGVRLFKMDTSYSSSQLLRMIRKAIQLNQLTEGRVRLCAYKDQGQNFFNIVTAPLHSDTVRRPSIKVMVSDYPRKKNKFSHVKALTYEPYFTANQDAKSKGYDEAVLLDPTGVLVEGATTNVFFIEKGVLFTPSVDTGCLNGIVRQVVIRLARQAGFPVQTGRFKLNRLYNADEFFLTNSLIGIKAGASVNKRLIGGKRNPGTVLFQELYRRYPKY